MNELEIRVVRNGYMVRPAYELNRQSILSSDDIRVFETFEALTAFLQSTLLKPKESSK